MKKSLFFFVSLLFLPVGTCLSSTVPKDNQSQITIAYTTNTWGQIEAVHS